MSFTHLHVHSGFSFLYWGQGTKREQIYFPSPMVTKSKKNGGQPDRRDHGIADRGSQCQVLSWVRVNNFLIATSVIS